MIFFDTIDSTTTWAVAHFAELNDRELVVAATQTAGRGRLDRKWISPRGNIYASFVQKNVNSPLLGVAAGSLAVLDLVRELAPAQKFHIKWPNDIFCGTAKISGILSQFISPRNGAPGGLVTGMGVNLNMTREQLASASQEATSVLILNGVPCDYEAALKRFEEILLDHFGGYTIQEANGGWKDGDIVYTEYTLVIYLSDTTLKDVHAAADEMVKTFHQSSVLIQANETTTEFYGGE